MSAVRKICHRIAVGGGLGLSPYAPGTVGSLAAVALYYLTFAWPFLWCVVGWCALAVVATWSVHMSRSFFPTEDSPSIVIDEVAGALLAFAMLPQGWYWIVVAFVAFRFFDIVKPWPAGWCDRKVKGAVGVMLDDVVAGVYAWATVQTAAAVKTLL